jgi:hypothetical protein
MDKNKNKLMRFWALNVGNMQAILSGFYLLHEKFFEIISTIFGHPTLQSSIKRKIVLELGYTISIDFLFAELSGGR